MENIISLIVEYSVGPIGKQFGYLVFYKSSIATLEEKFRRALEKKEAVQQSVNGAQWNQEVVASEVKTWLTNVEKKIEEIQKFLGEDVKANRMCLNGWCPDLKLCYSLGKKAKKNTQAIIQLLEEGEKYDRVYNIAPPLKVRSPSTELFKDFESRKSTIQNVLNALKNDNIDMIALCGMGGMGKTKMAKEIKRRVESDNLFHKVAITVVSQNPNFIKIQGELAESLGTRLKAESLQGRADELHSILTENKKVLLILDDVWKPLDNQDIEDIGVYYAFKEKSCKILLTSRNGEPSNGIEIHETFRVDLLSEEEAWNLFVEMTGDCVNSSDLISIAKQVAKECAGSPLAIATVGGALSNKSDKNEWKAALQQLKMSIPQNINGQLKVEREGSSASTTVAHKLFSSNTILWVPNLKRLIVGDCGSLEVVFDLEGLKVKENRKPILAVLSELTLWDLSWMSHVWKNIPPGFQGFQNLTLIDIMGCGSLRNLLSASIAKLLVQLQVVTIRDCNLMENIIQREYEAGEERRAYILSNDAHSLKWPSIKSINLWECPKLKTFGSEVRNERKLRKPRAKEPSSGSFPARESSGLFNRCLESCVSRHRNYSPAQGKSNSINKEITLTKEEEQNVSETENQAKMLSLFQYNMIESLENLEELSIHLCDSLEVIFELEGLNAEESNIFNNLTVLSLIYLPKLLHIWKKDPRDIKGFNYLRLLRVWECGSLKCLFTPSIAKLLVKLEEIEVYSCNEMEEFLGKELGDEENRDVIAFPLVKTLKLGNLRKLECFHTEDNHAFEWPSLDKITIVGCPKLKMLVSTSTKTPKLKGVHMKSRTFQPMVEGDLNATIQHIIKGEGLNQFSSPPFYDIRSYEAGYDKDVFDF
ncbi:uncharacterized protein LOC108991631 isoform X2 [Juglans regia]|uniref:Uncharacterized protein LOC108991631 isoform X2 n=1 Tax=Juglans regia TaxID=51240 RepID=A0A6P9E242_JUGRE|nr:uncharacterized protein LOC108991631 isoform X2 [Juglans regia]